MYKGWIFFLLFYGLAVGIPLFPLHGWLPVMAMQGPASVTATPAGLKPGACGVVRYLIPLAAQAAQEFAWSESGCYAPEGETQGRVSSTCVRRDATDVHGTK